MKIMRKGMMPLALLAALVAAGPVQAQGAMDGPAAKQADVAPASPLVEGEIRRVNKAAGKLTIRHAEITHLEMPPMTMVFRVGDTAMLDIVKPGDRIKFIAERVGGALTVTRIETVK